jgi:hypothetical protein
MIRREVFRQLTNFTYILENMEWDNQMRRLKTIDQVHVHPQAGEDSMIR